MASNSSTPTPVDDLGSTISEKLRGAAWGRDPKIFNDLLESIGSPAAVKAALIADDSLLTIACRASSPDNVRKLLSVKEIRAKLKSPKGREALMNAAQFSCPECTRALLSVPECEVDAADEQGNTALMYVCEYENFNSADSMTVETVRLLLDAGANPRAERSDGVSVTTLAEKHCIKPVRTLLKARLEEGQDGNNDNDEEGEVENPKGKRKGKGKGKGKRGGNGKKTSQHGVTGTRDPKVNRAYMAAGEKALATADDRLRDVMVLTPHDFLLCCCMMVLPEEDHRYTGSTAMQPMRPVRKLFERLLPEVLPSVAVTHKNVFTGDLDTFNRALQELSNSKCLIHDCFHHSAFGFNFMYRVTATGKAEYKRIMELQGEVKEAREKFATLLKKTKSKNELNSLSVPELEDMLLSQQLPAKGKKSQLVNMLWNAMEQGTNAVKKQVAKDSAKQKPSKRKPNRDPSWRPRKR
eukprot:m.343867 g.343867  ORF g.343867 m.343867 type:complete len:467 (+) comp23450_c0_seq1:158-1558(+)